MTAKELIVAIKKECLNSVDGNIGDVRICVPEETMNHLLLYRIDGRKEIFLSLEETWVGRTDRLVLKLVE